MPNYNQNNVRDQSINSLPRMTFQLPNTESGTALPSANPVFFCQSGCSIDYNFSNIKSCQVNNDGDKFTITPTDKTNINYIMWNGTDMSSGEKMVQYTLKEVYFTAPAKDYIGTNRDILNQSIQYYFVFVNEKYDNLMICVSIIGSVNNLGNAPKSNGFVMMETLSNNIPNKGAETELTNLNNFNLGTLIPPNKPFFSTLISSGIQYIILTEIVDVPVSFFTNIATKVNGAMDLYNNKMREFQRNTPFNPDTTVLFYNENSQLLDNQNLVCNSNCDLVPTKKITPSIGTYTTTESEKKRPETRKTISGAEFPPEKCEMEEVWSNQTIKPKKVKDPDVPDDPDDPDGTKRDKDNTTAIAITVSLLIGMVIAIILSCYYKYKKYGLSIKLIVAGIVGIIVTVVGLSVGCHLYVEKKDLVWLSYVLGVCGFFGAMVFILIIKNYDSYGYNTSYSSFNSNTNKQQPYSGITVPTGFNQPETSWFGKMFSSSSSHTKPITGYSPQITVPSVSNTQPKQSYATAPPMSVPSVSNTQPKQSFATVPSSMTVPQSRATVSPQPSKSFFSKLKDTFSRKPDSSSTTSSAPPLISDPVINKVSNLIKRISAQPNNKISSNKKKILINKLNRISKNPSSSSLQVLNEVSRELNTK
jgi:hypothetical protein